MLRRMVRLLWISFFVTQLSAAESWLEFHPTHPGSTETVQVNLRPSSARWTVARFQHLTKRSRENLSLGSDHSIELTLADPGVALLACDTRDSDSSGERYAKALIVPAGARAGGSLHWSEVGQRLEIVPQTDPVDLATRGGDVTLQVLHEREPLSDSHVIAHPINDPDASLRVMTDEIGLVRFTPPAAGVWVFSVVHDTTCRDCRSGLRRLRSSLTLAVGTR
ncbi:MAG: DUF4198 domain-containing protein [Acidobacteriota bacterium]|nr:DUF4198 domain-containing protein [Acidobacteriota bacterium]MDH3783749.1 DUF4198 domain-containing protein [Acidobacteriota bacterium]